MVGSAAMAATNDLSATLQRGLFEEEANHNLDAAIQAYQSVINQYDKDRKLAATAIFRLGESYRKQGKTNEATAQYERVLREFADQSELAAPSRAYLANTGPTKVTEAGAIMPTTSSEAEEIRRIQSMIKDSPDLINAMGNGGPPLHQAAAKGQLVVAQFLLSNGADVNAIGPRARPPLIEAADNGHRTLVELLLNKGASVGGADDNGQTALHLAASRGFRTVVELLLAHGAEVNAKDRVGDTPLHKAIFGKATSVAQLLLSKGADPNAMSSANGTPLHEAANYRDKSMAELLLANKADVNATISPSGEMALHFAALQGSTVIAELLLSHGAKVDAKSLKPEKAGWTPLHYALFYNQKEVVALLLRNNADPNAKFDVEVGGYHRTGYTPLLFAIDNHYLDIVELLLSHKADPNLKSSGGLVPILDSVSDPVARARAVTLLLNNHADVDARAADGSTPLIIAASRNDKDMVELLLENKANINAQDNSGWSALHRVAALQASQFATDFAGVAILLLNSGADVNLRDKSGKAPLSPLLAKAEVPDSNPAKLAGLLRKHGALKDLPRPDVIQVSRPTLNFSEVAVTKSTNDWNQFTVLEILAMESGLLTKLPQGESQERLDQSVWSGSPAAYPDLEKVKIKRPSSDFKGWQEQTVDLSPVVGSGDCSKNMPVEWGDVVEVPEADHPLNEPWPGFTTNQWVNFQKCLSRTVEVVLKGRATKVRLAPEVTFDGPMGTGLSGITFTTHVPFWIKPALRKSNVLLASSDLSHVKVTRRDPKTGQNREWILDCSDSKPAPDFWLREGDVIEVPDKS